tara:strand:- start:39 stop:590 length:552 start_codon:yes stop_codon:yes gene_type:complete
MASTIRVDTLQDAGANEYFASDGSGVFSGALTMKPSFRVTLSGDQTGIPDTTTTLITFDTNSGSVSAGECWDTNSAWDTSTYRFTVPAGEAGKYQFNWATYVQTLDKDERMVQKLYLNGSSTNYGEVQWQSNRSSGAANGTGTVTLELSVADYVDLRIWVNAGTTTTLPVARCFLCGYKMVGI